MTNQSYNEFFEETLQSSSFKEYDTFRQLYFTLDQKLAKRTFLSIFSISAVSSLAYLFPNLILNHQFSFGHFFILLFFSISTSGLAALFLACVSFIFCVHSDFLYKIIPGFSKTFKQYHYFKSKMIDALKEPKFQHVMLIKLEDIINHLSLADKERNDVVKKRLNQFSQDLKESFINENFENSLDQFYSLVHYLEYLKVDFSYKDKFVFFEEQQEFYKKSFGLKTPLVNDKEENLKEFNSLKKHL